MKKPQIVVPDSSVEQAIFFIRGQKVMLDGDLAAFYGVETYILKRAVRRNLDRFPGDFMFVLNQVEFRNWRSQFVTSKGDRQGLRHPPMAFTEHGIVMLSSVLNSKHAIAVNIEITRAFVNLRKILASHADLSFRLDELEKRYDQRFKVAFNAIRTLISPSQVKRKQIGFRSASRSQKS